MVLIRYGVKTASGSWYLIEDNTHLFRHPTWHIIMEGRRRPITGIITGRKGVPFPASRIKKIEIFIGHMIIFDLYHHSTEEFLTFPYDKMMDNFGHTNTIVDIITFK
ncbi:MAG: hypothetical protein IH934_04275 [Nanoarchaeota archaeon]|nr:hypothetical protein [Nanoarchaeota archaeon]